MQNLRFIYRSKYGSEKFFTPSRKEVVELLQFWVLTDVEKALQQKRVQFEGAAGSFCRL